MCFCIIDIVFIYTYKPSILKIELERYARVLGVPMGMNCFFFISEVYSKGVKGRYP